MNTEPRPRYRIRNGITGAYIHKPLCSIMEFYTRTDALRYIRQHELNRNIYYVEVVLSDRRRT